MEYPKGFDGTPTTKEQWGRYENENLRHEVRMALKRPYIGDFHTLEEYTKAVSAWEKECSMDAPNKPGYYRANND